MNEQDSSTVDPVAWLQGVQEQRGIAYTDDDAEERLRAAFAHLIGGDEASGEVRHVQYWGYREQPHPTKTNGFLRTTLRALYGTITLPNGDRFDVQLIGPYDAAGGGTTGEGGQG